MSLPKWATTVTPLSKILALIFFITFPILGFVLGANISIINNKNLPIAPTPTIEVNKISYANIELSLVDEKYNINGPASLVFGIEIPKFHKDWECLSFGYDKNGYRVFCQQTKCSVTKKILWPQKLNVEQQQSCVSELASREYSNLNNLSIEASEFNSENQIKDYSTLIDLKKLKKTPKKGIYYEFNKINKAKYLYLFSATLYSPFELTDRLSKLGGELYGSDWIYGKYIIEIEVSGDENENKVINLFEKVIDSIIFIKPE